MSDIVDVRRDADAPDWRGASLPGEAYTSPDVLARELEGIFARTWLLAGPADRLLNGGDYFTCDLAGQPLLLVRASSTEVRAFHNVCRHRGHRLVEAEQGKNAETFTCRYDQWTYALDGRLQDVPDEADYPDLQKAACGLVPVHCAVWNGLVFINCDPAADPLETYLAPLPECLHEKIEPGAIVRTERHEVNANWKVVLEAFAGASHIAGLESPVPLGLDPTQAGMYHFERHSMHVVPAEKAQHWPVRRAKDWRAWVGDPRYLEFHYTVFPNLSVHVFIHGLTLLCCCLPHPADPERTTLHLWLWARVRAGRPLPEPMSMQEANLEILQQFAPHFEAVQHGMRSRAYPGPLLSVFESRIGHFHAVWQRYLRASPETTLAAWDIHAAAPAADAAQAP